MIKNLLIYFSLETLGKDKSLKHKVRGTKMFKKSKSYCKIKRWIAIIREKKKKYAKYSYLSDKPGVLLEV